MVHHALPTLYQLHFHPTRKGHRPTPTHSTAHPVGYRSRGTTTATQTHQDANQSNLVGNLGSHGTLTRIRGDTRTPPTETNRQTPPGSSAPIRLLLKNGQEMAHRAHSARHTALLIGGTQHVLNHFAGDPTYNADTYQRLIRKHVRHHRWNTSTPTYEEYLRCLRAPKNKSARPDGVPPHLLRHLPNHIQQQLYWAIIAVWNGQNIPVAWLQSRVVLIYKKKDPQDPRNYRPIYVSTAIYSILTRLLLTRISRAMTPGLLDIQLGAIQGRNTTTLAKKLLNDLHTQDGYVALLDVAKAFPSVLRPMLTGIVKEAGAPENIIRMLGEIYQHTPAVLTLHARDLPIRPTRGMKEGCPLSPTLFLLYYDILLRENYHMAAPAYPRAATHIDVHGARTSPSHTRRHNVGYGYHTIAPRHSGVQDPTA